MPLGLPVPAFATELARYKLVPSKLDLATRKVTPLKFDIAAETPKVLTQASVDALRAFVRARTSRPPPAHWV